MQPKCRFYVLLGGCPFLMRCGLHEMVRRRLTIGDLEAEAALEHGIFGDRLRRLLHFVARDAQLLAAVRDSLAHGRCLDDESFYRLRSAGIILGDTASAIRPRCGFYRLYLKAPLR